MEQAIGNGDIFLHNGAVGLKQRRLIFLQKLFSLILGKPESQRAEWIHIGEHVAVERRVRVGVPFSFDVRVGCHERVVQR